MNCACVVHALCTLQRPETLDSRSEGAKTCDPHPVFRPEVLSRPDGQARHPQAIAAVTAPGEPPHLQVAALCWRRSGKGLKILLITSRDTGRWVIPKGWPMRNRSNAQAAAREAYEEAGLRGDVSERSVGIYTYLKALATGRQISAPSGSFPWKSAKCFRNTRKPASATSSGLPRKRPPRRSWNSTSRP